jgi:hypothetical protein
MPTLIVGFFIASNLMARKNLLDVSRSTLTVITLFSEKKPICDTESFLRSITGIGPKTKSIILMDVQTMTRLPIFVIVTALSMLKIAN